MDASELIYLAQWAYRRSLDEPGKLPVVAKAGDLLVKTAEAVQARSLEPQPEVEQALPGNDTDAMPVSPDNGTGAEGQ